MTSPKVMPTTLMKAKDGEFIKNGRRAGNSHGEIEPVMPHKRQLLTDFLDQIHTGAAHQNLSSSGGPAGEN